MRIQVLSDLHIDSYVKRGRDIGYIPQTDADIILVAGDTCNSDSGMSWLHAQAARLGKPIFTISGNHEYFGEDILTFDEQLASWDNYLQPHYTNSKVGLGVKFLQCDYIDFGEVRLFGCTLWTDFEYQATPDTIPAVMDFMRDYRYIKAGAVMFSPAISIQIHTLQRAWLQQGLIDAHNAGKTAIVMTHHSISPNSVSKKYANLPSNAAFVSDLSAWMEADWAPKLWVHGHTHEAFDYEIGHTRVIVNPRAYPNEMSSTKLQFDWAKVVEI